MQIVIDIREELYKGLKHFSKNKELSELETATINGVVLPQGHGDLIDRDELPYANLVQLVSLGNGNYIEREVIYKSVLDNAPTVLEADKGGKND